MEIYRVEILDMMGFRIKEQLFQSLEDAKQEYKRILKEYRQSDKLVKKYDVSQLSKPILKCDSPLRDNRISFHMIEVWYKCSYEYDEWDTAVEHLILEKVQVA